ncbi:MAG: hypothetical protein ACRDYZ_09000 [Acidimicrobiales bacterium]
MDDNEQLGTQGDAVGTAQRTPAPPGSTGSPGAATDQLSVAASLRLIERQRGATARAVYGDPTPILLSWGLTWLVGFSLSYFASSSRKPVPEWVAGAVFLVLGVGAAAISTVQMTRRSQGVAGPSSAMAAKYAWSWPVASIATAAFDVGLARHGLPNSVATLLWPGSFLVVTGALFLGGGALFNDRVVFGLGAWTLVTAAAGALAGAPANFAVMAAAGGGGLIVAGFVLRPRFRPERRR